MKIALYSDLHLEMSATWILPPELDVDVVILAGDIHVSTHGIKLAADIFRRGSASPAIIYVAGNHEYYGGRLAPLTAEMRIAAAREGVFFLENDAVEIDGVRFLGTTLWSDFDLHGADTRANSIYEARHCISDYSVIFGADRKFLDPEDTIQFHREARAFLERELAKPFDGKTVVVTHFAPHRDCVEARFKGHELTPYFTVDMTPLMAKYPIDLWAFGHTHYNVDFTDLGCRVICNQLGYKHERIPGFRECLVIEV